MFLLYAKKWLLYDSLCLLYAKKSSLYDKMFSLYGQLCIKISHLARKKHQKETNWQCLISTIDSQQ